MSIEVGSDARSEILVSIRNEEFDLESAGRLRSILREASLDREVTIDLRNVRVVHDTAVARLAQDLQTVPHVLLLGLTEHQRRLMRYFSTPSDRGQAQVDSG
jgi:anti-anti-sigma regulatory factor